MKTYKILDKIKNSKSVCIITHQDPDTDALSSAVVLKNFLMQNFNIRKVNIYSDYTYMPEAYLSIIGKNKLNLQDSEFDCAIIVDAPNIERLGRFKDLFVSSKLKFIIDHHKNQHIEGCYKIIEEISSCSQIIYKILNSYNFQFSKADYGKIYAGIITDTINFTVGATNYETLEIASACAKHVKISEIYSTFLNNTSIEKLHTESLTIKNLQTYDNKKIIISYITNEQEKENNITDYLGISNKLSSIKGCLFSCFIRPRKENLYDVSIRSKPGLNCFEIAKKYNGGGHICASGFISDKSINEIISNVLVEMRIQLKTYKENKKFNF